MEHQQELAKMAKTTKKAEEVLSFEQSKAVEDNMGLVWAFVRDFRGHSEYSRLEYDEWRDILIYSLIKAVKNHDKEKGALSTLYYSIAMNDVRYELRKPCRHKKSSEVSLDDLIDYGLEPSESTSYFMLEVEDILGKQSELWKLVHLVSLGYSVSDIARMEEISWTTDRKSVV